MKYVFVINPSAGNGLKNKELEELLKRYDDKIDYIIHMASSSNPKSIIENPVGIINANVIGTLNVLELARQNNSEVIFTSTREVYGDMKDIEIIKVNVDDYNDLARKYGIMSIPCLILFDKGKEIKRNIGFINESKIKEFIK